MNRCDQKITEKLQFHKSCILYAHVWIWKDIHEKSLLLSKLDASEFLSSILILFAVILED